MQIMGFFLGSAAFAAGVAVVSLVMDHSGWTALGWAVASFVLAQLVYLVWVAAMAVAEARQAKRRGPEADVPAKPSTGVVQKG